MSDAIIVALITGGISLIGSVLAIIQSAKKQSMELEKAIAVMQTEMSSMKEDIKSHNRYAQMFSESVPAIKQHMQDIERRLENMERRSA